MSLSTPVSVWWTCLPLVSYCVHTATKHLNSAVPREVDLRRISTLPAFP